MKMMKKWRRDRNDMDEEEVVKTKIVEAKWRWKQWRMRKEMKMKQ